ncbi:DNA (cytosine-5-)-methyltransferase [Streptococcus pyogenes]|uniref:DNA (cytosine-5-)-methyltransferase n=1 Tax=Streptococcus pyogenes TaxID=1314 RepID=UPI00109C37F4|nr:DNA (cytosine-5-)-methyltransferase [Streptococcus pyogenes]VGT90244.1 DNA-cytosine methyltransferase [Streptococcus pyogenes]VGV98498.1 C-5 cytosine-specific DNA methylase [Streptococcus pyogenes]VHA99032.1 C-5 cytosine-specific DNA methylase [Streptococcus pyogenes]VHC84882.1 C-5 cytosine-specific DNA methylase [Streptococcus pyogenes]VHD48991.1 C-5 cytosine-specific DNA methylase [Streptococcus pyogenes]
MKFFDCFAGIGGFRMGMESQGHTCIGFCEIDKFARRSYQAIFETEGELEYHDITQITDDQLRQLRGQVDVLCGGFPCQAFSLAGRRLGFEDTRGTLFFELARCAKEIQPPYLFFENVKGLLSHDQGRTYATILNTLDELGYHVEWQVLNSKDFGLPQNRERVFIIGHSRKRGFRPVFPFRGQGSPTHLDRLGNVNPSGKGMSGEVYLSTGLSPTLTVNKGEGVKIAIPVLTPDRLEKRQNGRRFKANQDPMFTLTAQDRHGVLLAGRLPSAFDQAGRVYDPAGLSPTLTTMQGGDKIPKLLLRQEAPYLKIREATKQGFAQAELGDSVNLSYPESQTKRGRVGKQIANTLTTSSQQGVVVAALEYRKDKWYEVTGFLVEDKLYRLRIRKLTPRECFRLQGFPDWAFDRAETVSSKSQLYKQAGNSVSVPVIATIAKHLKELEECHETTNKP